MSLKNRVTLLILGICLLIFAGLALAQDDVMTYLPLFVNPPPAPTATSTATPTPTNTPTATALPTGTPTPTPTSAPLLVIPNGDFEQGPGAGWYEYRSYANRPLIVQDANGLPIAARSGQWFAWLGADHLLGETTNHQSRIVHANTFDLPPGTPVYLHLYYQIVSEEEPNEFGVCDRDVINVWINNILLYQGQVCRQYNTTGWTPVTLDLSVFAGQTISLEFEMRTDFENISHLFLDDISFQSTP